MTILAFATLFIPALLGIAIISALRLLGERITILLVGSTLGIASYTTVLYVLTTITAPQPRLLWVTNLLALGIIVVLAPSAWQHWRRQSLDRIALILLVLLFGFSSIVSPKLLIEQPDGLSTGIVNAYGDVAWHLSNILLFAEGQTTPPENPIFSDTRLTYPFMINVHSALLVISGSSIADSVNWPALVFIPLLLTLFYCLVRELTNSKKVAVVAMLLFLFGGATFGWVRLPGDFLRGDQSLVEFITHLPMRDYSGVGTDENGFHFLNPVTTLLLPQRSLLIGFPIAFSILLLLTHRSTRNTASMVVAGILSGILPLWHGHTVLVLAITITGIALADLYQRRSMLKATLQDWIIYLIVALMIGLPEVFYYVIGTNEEGSFLRWGPRWLAGESNIVWYWFKNTGLIIPAAIAGLVAKRSSLQLKVLAGAGLIIFLIANLWLFAPWAWDNFKLFVYFFLLVLPLISWLAIDLIQRSPRPVKIAVVLLVALHGLSASIDLWKIALPTATVWQEWRQEDIDFAKQITAATLPGESILTAPNHNSAAVLAGRPRYLGYAAHVWSHGGDPWQREKAIKPFYEGQINQLPEVQPDYVLISHAEQGSYTIQVRPDWELMAAAAGYQLYKLPKE